MQTTGQYHLNCVGSILGVAEQVVCRESVARVIHQQSSIAQFVTTTFRAELLKNADRHFGVYFRGKASQVIIPIIILVWQQWY